MNPKAYGKKCKCGHFESDHVNLNKKFYEPNAIPEMGLCMSSPPTFDNSKISNVKDAPVTSLVRKRKAGCFGNDN